MPLHSMTAFFVLIISQANPLAMGVQVRDSEGNLISGQGVAAAGGDIFEVGAWAIIALLSNAIFCIMLYLYFRGPLRQLLQKYGKLVVDFEISKKTALMAVVAIISIFVSVTINDLFKEDPSSDYQTMIKGQVEDWSWLDNNVILRAVKFFLASSSFMLFGNMKIPFYLASVMLLVLTYFLAKEMTGKRVSGVIALVILAQSRIFLTFSASVTYDNVWFLFYMLSLYLIYRRWYLSPVSFILSLTSKPLGGFFAFSSLFISYESSLSKRYKLILTAVYGALAAAIIIIILSGNVVPDLSFSPESALSGMNLLPGLLRLDGPVYFAALLPLMVILYIKARNGIDHAGACIFLLLNIMLLPVLYSIFTNTVNEPHNFIPFIAFFAIGAGLLVSNRKVKLAEKQKSINSIVGILAIVISAVTTLSVIFPNLLSGV